jgi:hypothetical protein
MRVAIPALTLTLALAIALSACAVQPYEPMPTSPMAWEARQERIRREEDQRQRLCAMARPEDPRREQLCNTQPDPGAR